MGALIWPGVGPDMIVPRASCLETRLEVNTGRVCTLEQILSIQFFHLGTWAVWFMP